MLANKFMESVWIGPGHDSCVCKRTPHQLYVASECGLDTTAVCGSAHPVGQAEGKVGEQERKRGGVVHLGQGLPDAGAHAVTEGQVAPPPHRLCALVSGCSAIRGALPELSILFQPALLEAQQG